jgi:hypothetical protein
MFDFVMKMFLKVTLIPALGMEEIPTISQAIA